MSGGQIIAHVIVPSGYVTAGDFARDCGVELAQFDHIERDQKRREWLENEIERLRSDVRTKALEWGRTAQEIDAIVYP